MVIPGIKYGIYVGELLPSCRSVTNMLHWLERYQEGEVDVKLPADITDEDSCQRGPDGAPLRRVTPLVPFQTMNEWMASNE